jgi:hypothetical protein
VYIKICDTWAGVIKLIFKEELKTNVNSARLPTSHRLTKPSPSEKQRAVLVSGNYIAGCFMFEDKTTHPHSGWTTTLPLLLDEYHLIEEF